MFSKVNLGRANEDSSSVNDVSVQMYNDTKVISDVDVYLDGQIRELPYYRNLLQYMRRMDEEDKLTMWLNSPGGYLDTAMEIINSMRTAKGQIRVMATGHCASAATMIALAAPQIIVGDSCSMMFHAASYGSVGKMDEVMSHVKFNHTIVHKYMWQCYEGFMTKQEFENIMKGMDHYMDTDEIIKRLEIRHNWQIANGLVPDTGDTNDE